MEGPTKDYQFDIVFPNATYVLSRHISANEHNLCALKLLLAHFSHVSIIVVFVFDFFCYFS